MQLFTWVVQTESIKQASPRPPGYWPIESAVSYQAVMPVFNRELVPDVEEKSGLQPDNQSKELIMASLAGTISMAPALLMTFY
ncbi:hypothetical protein [Marinicella sediminis]|nr:hypothetical protein [Marinicella sediminis]